MSDDLPFSQLSPAQQSLYDEASRYYRRRYSETMPDIGIEEAQEKDFGSLGGVILRAYEPVCPDLYANGFDQKLTDFEQRRTTGTVLVAKMSGHAVGSVTYRRTSPTRALLEVLAVDPTIHRNGVGSALVQQGLQHAAADSVTEVHANLSPLMESAYRLLTGLGFGEDKTPSTLRYRLS